MPDQNIDPIALIEWMWEYAMQSENRHMWLTWLGRKERSSAELFELYKMSLNTLSDDCS